MKDLKGYLDSLYETFDIKFLSSDPLQFVHRFSDKRDQEVAGLIVSSLAYGQVRQILLSIERIMDIMNWTPYLFTINFDPWRDESCFNGFVHRFTRGEDMACLVYYMRQMIEECGSIRGFFIKGYHEIDRDVMPALSSFTRRVLGLDSGPIYYGRAKNDRGVRFFFPSPEKGSACKRLNLYLRWMVRDDHLDLGLWKDVHPSKLIIPLDTHIARISRNIGLTERKSPDWRMAEEITDSLKKLDPDDPVKYDFALCRLGILDLCPKEVNRDLCLGCPVRDICVA